VDRHAQRARSRLRRDGAHAHGGDQQDGQAEEGAKSARVTFQVAAQDDRDGALPVTCTPRSGSRFRIGRTRVDLNGDGATDVLTETVVPPDGDAVDDTVYLNEATAPSACCRAAIPSSASTRTQSSATGTVSATSSSRGPRRTATTGSSAVNAGNRCRPARQRKRASRPILRPVSSSSRGRGSGAPHPTRSSAPANKSAGRDTHASSIRRRRVGRRIPTRFGQ
jgi:hypothetical protein